MRIVIAYALAGIGHKKAAEALHVACAQAHHETHLIDALDRCTPGMRWLYPRLYLWLIARTPLCWGWGYACTDAQWLRWPLAWLRRLGNGLAANDCERWFIQMQPDVLVVTHFLPAEIASSLKRRGRLRAKLVIVVTDFHPHAFWIVPSADLYAVASETTRAALMARGVAADRIVITGIPVDARFASLPSSTTARAQLGLALDRPVITITGGGFGVGPMARIVETVVRSTDVADAHAQVAVVCGRNPTLTHAMERLAQTSVVPLRVFGFLNQMPALMAASDILVAKPGGLTVSEALAAGTPMILYGAIPGQETHNEHVLITHGAAVSARTPAAIHQTIVTWLRQPDELLRYRGAMRPLAHPDAAAQIVRHVVGVSA